MNFLLKFIYFTLIFLLLVPAVSGTNTIQVQGWNRITPIVSAAAPSYIAGNPGDSIIVTATDSGAAVRALSKGQLDIALGRDLEAYSQDNPEVYSHLKGNVLGKTALVIIVNPQNPVSHLSVDQIQKIYRGEIKNWADVGGANSPITTVGRNQYNDVLGTTHSGVRQLFYKTVMNSPEQFYPAKEELDNDIKVLQYVASNADSIGYAYFQYVDPLTGSKNNVKLLSLDIDNSVIPPSPEMIGSGNYPFYENLVIYTGESPTESTQKFVQYLQSPEGQYFVRAAGQLPVSHVSMPAFVSHEISGPDTIKTPGYYQLTKNITGRCPSDSCIAISSSDVILDGMGHSVHANFEGSSSTMLGISAGVGNRQISNVTIKNISVSEATVCINLYSVNGSSVTNSQVSRCKNGIESGESFQVDISKNVASFNSISGINVFNSNSVRISNNNVTDNAYGISFFPTQNGSRNHDAVLTNNRINKNEKYGIEISGYDFANVFANTISNSDQYALYLSTVNNSVIANNSLYQNKNYLACKSCGSNNTFSNNAELKNSPDIPATTIIETTTAFGFATIIIYLSQIPIPTLIANPLGELGFLKIIARLKIKSDDFMHHPVIIPLTASAALGVAFLFEERTVENPLLLFVIFTILGGVVVVSRWLVIFILARRSGLSAEIRFWWVGAFTAIITGLLFRNVVGTPVHTHIHEEKTRGGIGALFLVGPALSFLLSIIFLTLFFITADEAMREIYLKGIYLSIMTAFVNFLPVLPMDGAYVMKWNKWIWTGIFILLTACLFIPQFVMI